MVVLVEPEKPPYLLELEDIPDETPPPPYKFEEDHTQPYVDLRQRRNIFKRFSILHCGIALLFSLLVVSYNAFDHFGAPAKGGGRGHHGHHHAGGKHHWRREKRFEKLFLSVPDPEVAMNVSRQYATIPHLAGSEEDFESAKTILKLFQTSFNILSDKEPIFEAGSDESRAATLGITSLKSPSAWVDTYYPLLNTPLERSLELLDNHGRPIWSANLEEIADERDPEAAKYATAVPTFHGLSKDGEAEGQLVYVNYGSKEDYDELLAAGTNFTGKIVVARYGANFRGLKIKAAEELGAVGVLIYSDPRDDGKVTVSQGYAAYPAGPARNPTSVQRGSVQYISIYPGDPSTPNIPAYENATRVDGTNIPTIPSLPISWANAERLLEELGGLEAGRLLSGKYSKASVKLTNHVDTKPTKIWNVYAAIPGHIADEVVMVGNHRDAWVMGAADPTSGTVSLHEVVRGFSVLLRSGWKPLRTIVFASWDAEEYGLVGSTEYGEDFPEWISHNVVSYLNVDVSVSGSRWTAAASPSLAHLVRRTAKDIPHPTLPHKTLWDASSDEGPFEGIGDEEFMASYEAEKLKRTSSSTGIAALGSGSDYTVFLQRLGVASVDQGFGYTASDASYHYHSIYDSQYWQETFADPGFHRHAAIAKHLGLMTLRMTDAIILPLNTTQYVLELHDYLDKVEQLGSETSFNLVFADLRQAITELEKSSLELDEEKEDAEDNFRHLLRQLPGRRVSCQRENFRAAADWVKSVFGVPPSPQKHQQDYAIDRQMWMDIAFGNVEPETIMGLLDDSHPHHHHGLEFLIKKFIKAAKRVRRVNQKLVGFERGFISKDGIKDRTWYKHLGVSPGKWEGYGATTFPGLTEAIKYEKNQTLVEYEAARLTNHLRQQSTALRP